MGHITKVVDKHTSPLTVQCFDKGYGKIFVGIIADKPKLADMAKIVTNFEILSDQSVVSMLSEEILSLYDVGEVEGLGVLYMTKDTTYSSLYGDFMNHTMCRDEFYNIVDTMVAFDSYITIPNMYIRKYNIIKGWPIWLISNKQLTSVPLSEWDDEVVKHIKQYDVSNNIDTIISTLDDLAQKLNAIVVSYFDKGWYVASNPSLVVTQAFLEVLKIIFPLSPHV